MLGRMSHATTKKRGLLHRVNRIRGQVEAIGRGLEREHDCSSLLQIIAACRGAIDGLMAEVIEDHIKSHLSEPRATKTLLAVVRSYLK